ncbi:MAG: Mut7-C RNAse domain-containing protein [Myxococcota bacterium]
MKLLCDSMLGRLTRYLRLLGIDTMYTSSKLFDLKIELARDEERIFLSRDTRLLKRKDIPPSCFVRSNFPEEQIYEVINTLNISPSEFKPFSRCLRCNSEILPIKREEVSGRVPDYVMRTQEGFSCCKVCNSIYWRATHYVRMQRVVDTIIKKLTPPNSKILI